MVWCQAVAAALNAAAARRAKCIQKASVTTEIPAAKALPKRKKDALTKDLASTI